MKEKNMVTVLAVNDDSVVIHFAGANNGTTGLIPIHLFPNDVKVGDEVVIDVLTIKK
jgi:hypothetical protein